MALHKRVAVVFGVCERGLRAEYKVLSVGMCHRLQNIVEGDEDQNPGNVNIISTMKVLS